jgi:hypothetical protein
MNNYIKHKFYLIYSRSIHMLSHKKTRFFNRIRIETNHPYSVLTNHTIVIHLSAFAQNSSTVIDVRMQRYPFIFG